MMDLSAHRHYRRLEEMLADPNIDLIDVCNPTHLHPETAIKALEAGKHVLVEKAIALDPKDADAMLAAARKANRLLMVAHVLPFFPEFAYAADAIRGGRHGKLLGAHFKRVISKPDWSAEIGDAAKTGGPAVDLHIHDTHFIGLVAGVPKQVFSTGIVSGDAVDYLTTSYLYAPPSPGTPDAIAKTPPSPSTPGSTGKTPPSPGTPGEGSGVRAGPAVTCSSGAIAMKGRPFVHGYEIYLEKATLVYESGTCPLTVLTADGKSEQPKLDGGADATTAFTIELQAAVDGISAGKEPDLLSAKLARDALVLCHREIESVQTGKAVAV
jgi:predicted dehydrogenase